APIFHHERFARRVFQPWSQRQSMSRSGHDAAYRKNAFGLTFPEKPAVALRLDNKRAWLITNIYEIGTDHRDGKRDRDRVLLGDPSARRLDYNAARIS